MSEQERHIQRLRDELDLLIIGLLYKQTTRARRDLEGFIIAKVSQLAVALEGRE